MLCSDIFYWSSIKMFSNSRIVNFERATPAANAKRRGALPHPLAVIQRAPSRRRFLEDRRLGAGPTKPERCRDMALAMRTLSMTWRPAS